MSYIMGSTVTVSAVMAEPGTVLYCNLFVPALYSVHWVEVKPRSLTKTDFDSSVGEGSEISRFCTLMSGWPAAL